MATEHALIEIMAHAPTLSYDREHCVEIDHDWLPETKKEINAAFAKRMILYTPYFDVTQRLTQTGAPTFMIPDMHSEGSINRARNVFLALYTEITRSCEASLLVKLRSLIELENFANMPNSMSLNEMMMYVVKGDEMKTRFNENRIAFFNTTYRIFRRLSYNGNSDWLDAGINSVCAKNFCVLKTGPSHLHKHCFYRIGIRVQREVIDKLRIAEKEAVGCTYIQRRRDKSTTENEYWERCRLDPYLLPVQNKHGGWLNYVKPRYLNPHQELDVAVINTCLVAKQLGVSFDSVVEELKNQWRACVYMEYLGNCTVYNIFAVILTHSLSSNSNGNYCDKS